MEHPSDLQSYLMYLDLLLISFLPFLVLDLFLDDIFLYDAKD